MFITRLCNCKPGDGQAIGCSYRVRPCMRNVSPSTLVLLQASPALMKLKFHQHWCTRLPNSLVQFLNRKMPYSEPLTGFPLSWQRKLTVAFDNKTEW